VGPPAANIKSTSPQIFCRRAICFTISLKDALDFLDFSIGMNGGAAYPYRSPFSRGEVSNSSRTGRALATRVRNSKERVGYGWYGWYGWDVNGVPSMGSCTPLIWLTGSHSGSHAETSDDRVCKRNRMRDKTVAAPKTVFMWHYRHVLWYRALSERPDESRSRNEQVHVARSLAIYLPFHQVCYRRLVPSNFAVAEL
jgi:hypothetical protein